MNLQRAVLSLALISLSACISDSPSHDVSSEEKAVTYLEMGVRYMEIGDLKVAKENLEKALYWDSSNAEVQDAIAVLYEKIQEPQNASQHYQAALRIDPENPQLQNNYGRFLCDQGQIDDGLNYLEAAVNKPLNNRKWFALTNAGRCLLKQGDKRKAESYFRLALQLQDDYAPALLEMLKMTYRNGQYLSAKAFFQRYQGLISGYSAELLWYGMQIERALEHRTLAEQYRRRLLNDFPTSEEANRAKNSIND
jgi:type IV pilus assembly protein PilF